MSGILAAVKGHLPLIVLLVFLGLYRASLLGSGTFAWPDELNYDDALRAVDFLARGDIADACKALTGFSARPGEATLRLIPAAIQIGLERTQGISRYNPQSLGIAAAFNIIASLLASIIFYRLSTRLLSSDRWAAVVATMVFSLLVSSNVFVRHLIPYDTAIFLCLFSLLLGIQREPRSSPVRVKGAMLAGMVAVAGLLLYPLSFFLGRGQAKVGAVVASVTVIAGLVIASRDDAAEGKHWALVGLVAGFGLVVYPAYYPFPMMVGAILVLRTERSPYVAMSRARLRAGLVYGLAVLSVLFAYEVVARVGDVSYLASAYRMSGAVTQGSFEEGYVFIGKYLFQVEGAIGVMIVCGATAYGIILARKLFLRLPLSPHESRLAICCIVSAALYCIYATQSTVFHRMVFTGRFVRMYVPFAVFAAVASLQEINSIRLRTCAQTLLVLCSTLSFIMFDRDYRALAYPVNVLYANGIRWEDINPSSKVYEAERIHQEWVSTAFPHGLTGQHTFVTRPNDERFTLLNFGFFALAETRMPDFRPSHDVKIIYQAPHFLTFRSSLFEAFSIEKRAEMVRRNYQIAIFRSRTLGSQP